MGRPTQRAIISDSEAPNEKAGKHSRKTRGDKNKTNDHAWAHRRTESVDNRMQHAEWQRNKQNSRQTERIIVDNEFAFAIQRMRAETEAQFAKRRPVLCAVLFTTRA